MPTGHISKEAQADLISRGKKSCARCREVRPLDEFPADRHQSHGYHSNCRSCLSEYHRSRSVKDPEKLRRDSLRYKYGISIEQYDEMLSSQNGKCAICGGNESLVLWGKIVSLAVDHDHSCCPGKRSCGNCLRGLLCNSCNRFVGKFEANYERTSNYLNKFRSKKDGN